MTIIAPLRPYMVHSGSPENGAVLVFARNGAIAKRIGGPVVIGWEGCEWIDVRAKRIHTHVPYLMTLMKSDRAHVIESPPTCTVCERWGAPLLDKGCELCSGEGEETA